MCVIHVYYREETGPRQCKNPSTGLSSREDGFLISILIPILMHSKKSMHRPTVPTYYAIEFSVVGDIVIIHNMCFIITTCMLYCLLPTSNHFLVSNIYCILFMKYVVVAVVACCAVSA